ncbi:MAG: ABC transporter ATP-binding protein [Alistipes sp.]|jgi:zinc transport system ATP-binding protein|nr:ABC transporter ATP-binding protein [Alistipes sp.]
MSIVSLKNVTVKYGSYTAIESANLEIFEGDFIGIIGPNGGGKTTLIKTILGSVPYSGEITLSPTLFDNGRRLIGYLPQQTTFDRQFPISVIEVVLSGLQSQKGFSRRYKTAERNKALQLLDNMGISSIADRQIGEISGGQMQRVLLCRAIIAEPKLLILDEPTNFVDKRFESELYDILRELNKQMTIVMVSHDVHNISSAVKSIVCVNRTIHRHNTNTLSSKELNDYCFVQ